MIIKRRNKKIKCSRCGGTRTNLHRKMEILLKDIGDPKKKLKVTYSFCLDCNRHTTQYANNCKAKNVLATKRLLKLVYDMMEEGKSQDDITKKIGYRLPRTTVHDYYYIYAGQLLDDHIPAARRKALK